MGQTHDTPPAADTTGTRSPSAITNGDIYDALWQRQCIAIIWSSEDVHEIRPDLTLEQCWDVLQSVDRHYDPEEGISVFDIEQESEELFGPAPTETDHDLHR